MKRRQLLTGVGVVALGVCAALPFQRSPRTRAGAAAEGPAPLSLEVRGRDVPEAVLKAELPPLEDGQATKAEEERPSPFPARPHLERSRELPRLAKSFDQAEPRKSSESVLPAAPPPNTVGGSPSVGGGASSAERGAPNAGEGLPSAAGESPMPPPLAEVGRAVELGLPMLDELPAGRGSEVAGAEVASSAKWGSAATGRTPAAETLDPGPGQWRPAGSKPPLPEAPLPKAPATGPRTHRIRDGDTLPDLARRYLGDASRAVEIFDLNRDVLPHPDILPLGRRIVLPEP